MPAGQESQAAFSFVQKQSPEQHMVVPGVDLSKS